MEIAAAPENFWKWSGAFGGNSGQVGDDLCATPLEVHGWTGRLTAGTIFSRKILPSPCRITREWNLRLTYKDPTHSPLEWRTFTSINIKLLVVHLLHFRYRDLLTVRIRVSI
jgi:hypothetical protein